MASNILAKMREKVMRSQSNTVVVATDDLEALIDLHDSAVASVEAFKEHCGALAAAKEIAEQDAANQRALKEEWKKALSDYRKQTKRREER